MGSRGAAWRTGRDSRAHGDGRAWSGPPAPALPHPPPGVIRLGGPRRARHLGRGGRGGEPGLAGGAGPGHRRRPGRHAGSCPTAAAPSRRSGARWTRPWPRRSSRSSPNLGRRRSSGWPDRDRPVPPPEVPVAPLAGLERRGDHHGRGGRPRGVAPLAHEDPGRSGSGAAASAGARDPGPALAPRSGRRARAAVLGVRRHGADLLRGDADGDGDDVHLGAPGPAHGL